MAQREPVFRADIDPRITSTLKSYEGIVDFWDGIISQEKSSDNKVKWKRRYMVLQGSQDSFLYLLIYKHTQKKKKRIEVPVMKFTLVDETSSIFVGPSFKNKYTFDLGVRMGKLFMRYRFGLDSEELRNKWIYEVVTSFYLNPYTPINLTYLVTPINTLEVKKLKLNEPSYLLLFKDHIELCRLSDHARLGKWPVTSVHSYTTDKNVFTIKFKQSSMYGEIEIPFCSEFTIDMFRILHSLITTGKYPQGQEPGIKRNKVIKVRANFSNQLPDMLDDEEMRSKPVLPSGVASDYVPIKRDDKVKKTKSNPDQNKIFPTDNYDPSSPLFNTTPHQRKGSPFKQRRINSKENDNNAESMAHYDRLNYFKNTASPEKERSRLKRTNNVMSYSELFQASHSTGNIPTLYSTISRMERQKEESPYNVANFHKIPGLYRPNFSDNVLVRSNSEQQIFENPSKNIYEQLPLTKTNSLHDVLSDNLENENEIGLDSCDVKPPMPPRNPLPKSPGLKIRKNLPPPPPPLKEPIYDYVTLPERGERVRGMRKSPSTDNHIWFGRFSLDDNIQTKGNDNQNLSITSPKHEVKSPKHQLKSPKHTLENIVEQSTC